MDCDATVGDDRSSSESVSMDDTKQRMDTTTAATGCLGSVAAVRMGDHGTKKAVLLVVVVTVLSDRSSSSRLQWNSGADDRQG